MGEGKPTLNEAHPRRRNWKAAAWMIVAAVSYLMSIGPVCKLCFDHSLPTSVLRIYKPVWELARFPGPGRGLSRYLNLWGSRWSADYKDGEHGVLISVPPAPRRTSISGPAKSGT
jgi:hypothetical protein